MYSESVFYPLVEFWSVVGLSKAPVKGATEEKQKAPEDLWLCSARKDTLAKTRMKSRVRENANEIRRARVESSGQMSRRALKISNFESDVRVVARASSSPNFLTRVPSQARSARTMMEKRKSPNRETTQRPTKEKRAGLGPLMRKTGPFQATFVDCLSLCRIKLAKTVNLTKSTQE